MKKRKRIMVGDKVMITRCNCYRCRAGSQCGWSRNYLYQTGVVVILYRDATSHVSYRVQVEETKHPLEVGWNECVKIEEEEYEEKMASG